VNITDAVISRALEKANIENATLRFGVVKAITGKTLTVTLGGIDIPLIAHLKSYTPHVGDRVWLLHQGSTLVALGSN
jgi:hypothetical protein